jgi:hypothetical protein
LGDDVLRLLCVQLFSIGVVEDSLLLWDAKRSSFDAGLGSVDVQFLCGAGLEETKAYLSQSAGPPAAAALNYLLECARSSDFCEWTPQNTLDEYRRYFHVK